MEEEYERAWADIDAGKKTEGFKVLLRLAEQGYAVAQLDICQQYGNDEVPAEYSAKVFELICKAAEDGHDEVQNCLGTFYHLGKGVVKDLSKAVEWYRRAAEQGNELAQSNLEGLRRRGLVGETPAAGTYTAVQQPSPKQSETEPTDPEEQYTIALECFEQDPTKAVYWFTKAANQGNADAQALLGSCYYEGVGVPKDLSKAIHWLTKAAEQGNIDAQYNLGVFYYNGIGVPKDFEKAASLFSKVAEMGIFDAQYAFGVMLYTGQGVKKDTSKAKELLSNAANQGHANSLRLLMEIKNNTILTAFDLGLNIVTSFV